jgi:serine/threonine-protein kinase
MTDNEDTPPEAVPAPMDEESLAVTQVRNPKSERKSLDFFAGRLNTGDKIGSYEIIDKIAQGGSATIYRAEHLGLQRTVALKVMAPVLAKHPDYVDMFVREARATAKLKHPNIVQTFDAGTCNGTPYLAMELVDGGNLMELIQNREDVDTLHLLEIMKDVADALHYGQEKLHLTHGDIKPENVLLDLDGIPHLADFGLSETIACRRKKSESNKNVYTTPLYAAPETLSRSAIPGEPHPDIYSFGCMMFYLITGDPPFKGTRIEELIYCHMQILPPELNTLIPSINYNLNKLVAEMMSKNPAKRPKSWSEIRDRLGGIIEEIKTPLRYTAKRHISLAFSFTSRDYIFIITLYAAILISLHRVFGIVLISLIILVNYLLKSVNEPQSWVGMFKSKDE